MSTRSFGRRSNRSSRFESADLGPTAWVTVDGVRCIVPFSPGSFRTSPEGNDERAYETPSGVVFSIHPSSGLKQTDVPWVMVSEIVETTRRYGRMAAKVRGDWVERVAPHLVRREYEEPHYLIDSGQVAAYERVYYGGMVLVPRRRVAYGPLDPEVARDIFIQEALVEEKLRTRALFMLRNIALRKRVEALEEKERRRDLLASNDQRFRFYDELIPSQVHSAPSFERWRLQVEARDPTVW